MTYPYYQSNVDAGGWGNNQFQFGRPPTVQFQPQPSWRGSDFFRAYAPDTDPEIFNRVYNSISGAGAGVRPFGVSIGEARLWHHRAYSGLGAINALTPQEIGYASAYEAYRIWIHNTQLYEPLGREIERQREALIGLAVAEASRMYMSPRPADVWGLAPACEAAAATAMLIFDQNLMGGAGEDISNAGMRYGFGTGSGAGYDAGMGYGAGMGAGVYGSGFGPPGMAGPGMSGAIDPYAIDYEAPYFRQTAGRYRRLSMPSPGGGGGMPVGGSEGSPYLGAGGMGANPAMYRRRSPMPGGYGGALSPGYPTPTTGGGSPINRSPMIPASPPNFTQYPAADVTRVQAYPGTTTVIQLPRRHRRHHGHHSRRAHSAEPTTHTGATRSPIVGGAFDGAAKVVGGAVGGITGGTAGLVGGAVGGLARGVIGGFRGATAGGGLSRGAMGAYPVGVNGPMQAGMGGYYPGGLNPNMGPSYPGYKGLYRY